MEGGRRIIVPVAPRWQLFVLTKTQIIILILGSPLLHDMTALLGLCVETEHRVQFPAQFCCYYTGSLPSQTWFILQHGCTQSVRDSLTEGWWYMSLCLHHITDMSQGVTTRGSDITGVMSHRHMCHGGGLQSWDLMIVNPNMTQLLGQQTWAEQWTLGPSQFMRCKGIRSNVTWNLRQGKYAG